MIDVGEVRGAEKHVPPREDHAIVAPAEPRGLVRRGAFFMTKSHRVVRAMEARRNQQALAQPAKVQAQIGVLQTLQQLRQRYE